MILSVVRSYVEGSVENFPSDLATEYGSSSSFKSGYSVLSIDPETTRSILN